MKNGMIKRVAHMFIMMFTITLCMLTGNKVTAKTYSSYLKVMGTNVDLSSSNADIKGDGHFSYDAATKKLTVRGVINHSGNQAVIDARGLATLNIYFDSNTQVKSSSEVVFMIFGSNVDITSGVGVDISVNASKTGSVTGFDIECSEVTFNDVELSLNVINQNKSYYREGIFLAFSKLILQNSSVEIDCDKESLEYTPAYVITAVDNNSVLTDGTYTSVRSTKSDVELSNCSFSDGYGWSYSGTNGYVKTNLGTGTTVRKCQIVPLTYRAVVNNGTGGGSFAAGASVTIVANAPESGKQFKEWTGVDGLTFTSGSKTSSTSTFTMPAKAVSLTATYEDITIPSEKPSGGSGDDSKTNKPNNNSSANTDDNLPTKTESIDPKLKTTTLSKPKAEKKSVILTWKKQTKGGIKGYEIQYSTDKKFKKDVKVITVKKAKTTKKTIKKLTSKKKYYVRIRTFRKSGKEFIYSKWSKTKSVKVK